MEKLLADNSLPVMAYGMLNRIGGNLQSAVLLALRLTWGFEAAQSGFGHLTHVKETVEYFTSLGVPMPTVNVYISGVTELAGGILLIIGLGTRLVSIPFIFNFIVAIASASHEKIGKAFKADGITGWYTKIIDDTAFPFMMLGLIVLAFGAGKISIDYLLGWKLFCTHDAPERA